ncbi:hypothetical protein Tco_0498138, partial [Tanacetum coccineum]
MDEVEVYPRPGVMDEGSERRNLLLEKAEKNSFISLQDELKVDAPGVVEKRSDRLNHFLLLDEVEVYTIVFGSDEFEDDFSFSGADAEMV